MKDLAGQWRKGAQYAGAVAIVAVVTGFCLVLRSRLAIIDVAMLLLVGVVAASSRYPRGPALLACLLSIASLNFFFVPPYYTFSVGDRSYVLTFGVMLVVAVTMSRLTARVREQRETAIKLERITAASYRLERELSAASDRAALRDLAARRLGESAGGKATILLVDEVVQENGLPVWPSSGPFANPEVRVAASWAWQQNRSTGWGTDGAREADAMLVPLGSTTGALGIVAIAPADPDHLPSEEQRQTIAGLVSVTANAVERQLLAERTERARTEVEAERLRTALLSSLSHDLRTPLAGIEGAASSLLQDPGRLSRTEQRELLDGIVEESRRMTRLISNLLNLIRVETNTLRVQKSWQPFEEVLGVVLVRLEQTLRANPVTTRIPDDLPLVPVDELLIEQVLVNLLENAVRYTPPGTPIEVTAGRDAGAVVVGVLDRGPGVPAGEEEAVFRRFYRAAGTPAADAGAGSGLGLTICRGIITAHGGSIWIEPREGGGTAVWFSLPLTGPRVEPVPEELVER